MNGLQMSYFLSMDEYTSKFFKGIVMRDTSILPHHMAKPALYILNTDSEGGKGEHWCVAFFENKTCEFFDPLGMDPNFYGFMRIINTRDMENLMYNPVCVQDPLSICCGHHCLFFCFHRCRGYTLADIIGMYNPGNVSWNNSMVTNFTMHFGNWFKPLL